MPTRRTLLTALATLTLATPTLAQNYTQPTTPDGQPDISGIWTSFDTTPFEVETPEVLADLKALAYWFPGVDGGEGGPGVGAWPLCRRIAEHDVNAHDALHDGGRAGGRRERHRLVRWARR